MQMHEVKAAILNALWEENVRLRPEILEQVSSLEVTEARLAEILEGSGISDKALELAIEDLSCDGLVHGGRSGMGRHGRWGDEAGNLSPKGVEAAARLQPAYESVRNWTLKGLQLCAAATRSGAFSDIDVITAVRGDAELAVNGDLVRTILHDLADLDGLLRVRQIPGGGLSVSTTPDFDIQYV